MLKEEILTADAKAQYDANVKMLLANKEILCWILKETVEEFEDMQIPEIKECIEPGIEIASMAVHPNTPDKITGMSTEDKSEKEKNTYFDIRFVAYAPKKQERIKLIINIEAQRKYQMNYPIVTRGIYYGARMISAQRGTEFDKSNYQDIKKVYSIWLCMNCEENGIAKFSFSKQDIMGHMDVLKEDYDLISVIIVRLTSEYDTSQMSAMIRILNILLSKAGIYSGQKKIKMLKDEGVHISQEIEEEVIDMCNWSEGIADRARAEGMEKGAISSIRILLGFSMDKKQIQRSVQSEFELTEEQFEKVYKQAVEGNKS